ncbi:MAG TPA: hypothetical protein DHW63_05270 [Hyphomonadaceae bacterium]|nr:hypothetical protein [Hyphomonadaceae bacterium]
MRRIFLALALAVSISACATGTTNITLTTPQTRPAVLAEAPSTRIDVAGVTDSRSNTGRIGDKRNGYGMVMGAVGSTQPPAAIVEQALEQVMTANNHVLGGAEDRYALQTTLRTFWFDYKTGLVTVEFFGTIQAEVALVDRTTGQTLYTETFEGYNSERTGGGLSRTWTRIMDAALADFATKVSLSEGLKAALAATHAPAPATGS